MWKESDSALLWVEGKPGSGKSVLAKTLQKTLAGPQMSHRKSTETGAKTRHDLFTNTSTSIGTKTPKTNPQLVAYWFYHSRGGDVGMAHESLLRSILYQLLQQNEEVFDVIAPIYRQHKPGKPLIDSFGHSSFDLLQKIGGTGLSIVCIVDAMDEAKGLGQLYSKDVHRARTILSQLGNLLSKIRNSRMKFIVLSRPDPAIEIDYSDIKHRYYNTFKVVLDHENEDDIHYIIEKGIGSLQNALHAYDSEGNNNISPANARKYKGLGTIRSSKSASGEQASLERIRSYLKMNAEGVILWVTLILGQLENHAADGLCTFPELEQLMETLPVHLDKLYDYILEELEHRCSNKELERTKKTFILISGSAALNRPIRLRELWDALAIPIDIKTALDSAEDPIVQNRVPISSWVGLRRQLLRKCGPLIEVVAGDADHAEYIDRSDSNIGPDDIVQFMHRSVKDFLHSPHKRGPLHFSEVEAIAEVRAIAKGYIEIAFPTEKTLYGPPLPAMEDSLWQDNINKWINYLERRILLCFCLTILGQNTNESPIHLGNYASFDNLIYVDCGKEEDPPMEWEKKQQMSGNEILFFPRCLDWLEFDWIGAAGAFAFGHALYSACSKGLVIATRGILDLCKALGPRRNEIWDYVILEVALLACIEHGFLADVQTICDNKHSLYPTMHDCNLQQGYDVESQEIPGFWLDAHMEFAVRIGQEQIFEYLWEENGYIWQGKVMTGDHLFENSWDKLFCPGPSSLNVELSSEKSLANEGMLDITEIGAPNSTNINNIDAIFPSDEDMSIAFAGIGEWIEHTEVETAFRYDEAIYQSCLDIEGGNSVHAHASEVDRETATGVSPKELCLRAARKNFYRRLFENTGEILLDDIRDAVNVVMEVVNPR